MFRHPLLTRAAVNWLASGGRIESPLLTPLANRFCFRSAGNFGDSRQACHRDLSKPRAEAIEPLLYADRCDRKIANRGVVNAFDLNVP
jgi:hypothetical protein